MPRKLQRCIILGAGAVGGTLGGLLFGAGLPVVFLARGEHARVLRAKGLSLRLPDRAKTLAVPCVERLGDISWQDGDVAFLTTKLQDAEALLDGVRACVGDAIPILCATNGVHGERWAAARFLTVLSTVVWIPATHLDPGQVRLHSRGALGTLDTGPVCGLEAQELAEDVCAWFRRAGFDALPRADIAAWKIAKWVTNLGGAAQAMVQDDWKHIADLARAEGEAVLEAAGLERVATSVLLDRVKAVRLAPVDGLERRGGSTWQSFARNQPLETPWIEGALAALAGEVGVPAPINAFLAKASHSPERLTAAEVLARASA